MEIKKFKSLKEILEENKEFYPIFGGMRGGYKTEFMRAYLEGKFPQDEDSPHDAFRYFMMRPPKVKIEKKEEKPMYESPISINHFVEPMMEQFDDELGNTIVKTCVKVGVDVDKDRLLKALEGDKAQYYKGYKNGEARGYAEAEERTKKFLVEVIKMGKEFIGLTDEELCDLICGKPEDEEVEEDD